MPKLKEFAGKVFEDLASWLIALIVVGLGGCFVYFAAGGR